MAGKLRSIERDIEKRQQAELPKSITLTLKDVLNSVPALQEIANQPIPAKISFRLGVLIRKVNERCEVYQETRKALCEKYGEENQDEGKYDIRPEEQDTFNKELDDLLAEEVTFNVSPIKLRVIESVPLSPGAMASLHWLVVE